MQSATNTRSGLAGISGLTSDPHVSIAALMLPCKLALLSLMLYSIKGIKSGRSVTVTLALQQASTNDEEEEGKNNDDDNNIFIWTVIFSLFLDVTRQFTDEQP
jgi:hypothetical protein